MVKEKKQVMYFEVVVVVFFVTNSNGSTLFHCFGKAILMLFKLTAEDIAINKIQ